MVLDTSFDFRSDANGDDPDKSSPTLRRYHKLLWSKPLPSGVQFELDVATPGEYLHHRSDLGEFFLSSDSVMPTFNSWESVGPIVDLIPAADREAFVALAYTIGGMIVFPANRIDGKWTINQARGMLRTSIADRFDLTLECIRRYYLDQASPLADTLGLYAGFFALFDDFRGYVDFFLLQDLVGDGYASVKFFMPFDDFHTPATPTDLDSYTAYRDRSKVFINARNKRIAELGV